VTVFKTPEEKAAKQAERDAKEFEASPVGQARAAAQRGDGYFELEVDLRATGNLNPWAAGQDHHASLLGSPNRPRQGRMDVLSQVEAEGWGLLHVSHVFVQTGEESRDKLASSGQRVAVRGKIVGIYLFGRAMSVGVRP
jgi:hypothetical protein